MRPEVEVSRAQRVSAAAHARLAFANPLSASTIDAAVAWCASRQPASALDIGCGFAPIALRLARATPVHVVALDTNPLMLARAARALRRARPELQASVELRAASLTDAELAAGTFDLVICIGSSHAVGTPAEALARCQELASARGGAMLFGELVWAAAPPQALLDYLGDSAEHLWPSATVAQRVADAGWRIQWRSAASPADWLRYERAVHRGRLRYADSLPTDEAAMVTEMADAWWQLYQIHGHCLGFELFAATRT